MIEGTLNAFENSNSRNGIPKEEKDKWTHSNQDQLFPQANKD